MFFWIWSKDRVEKIILTEYLNIKSGEYKVEEGWDGIKTGYFQRSNRQENPNSDSSFEKENRSWIQFFLKILSRTLKNNVLGSGLDETNSLINVWWFALIFSINIF